MMGMMMQLAWMGWIMPYAMQAFSFSMAVLRIAALILVILACVKYLRAPKKPE